MHRDSVRHLYVHIPFCAAKCPYCAFVTHVGSPGLVEPYVQALIQEIGGLAGRTPGVAVSTVYLGGGTPTILTPVQITRILEAVDRSLTIAGGAEITLEAHPGSVTPNTLSGFCQAGATRISFGGESLQLRELHAVGRTHGPERVLEAVDQARSAGFRSVNVDLMYGLPGQTLQSWRDTLCRLLLVRPEHISLYPLQIEPRTLFGRRHAEGRLHVPDDDLVVEMYQDACTYLREEGYEHYEIANWALPGFECRHNLAYWLGEEYFAAGVGAHGYVRPYRTENLRSTRRYIDTLMAGGSPVAGRELIDRSTEVSEKVVLGLRLLRRGLDLDDLEAVYGGCARTAVEELAASAVERGELRARGSRLHLEERAVPLANNVLDRFVSLDIYSQGSLPWSALPL